MDPSHDLCNRATRTTVAKNLKLGSNNDSKEIVALPVYYNMDTDWFLVTFGVDVNFWLEQYTILISIKILGRIGGNNSFN